jgi:hypothetical protein
MQTTNINRLFFITLAAPLGLVFAGCGGASAKDAQQPTQATATTGDQAAAGERAAAPTAPAVDSKPAQPKNPAPDFSLPDVNGTVISLATYRGKTVVLEWFNPGCPFVRHAHSKGPLKDMAAKQSASGIVWLVINSGAPGKQGAGAKASKDAAKQWKMETPILLDEQGKVGHAFGAKSTPHIFIVDATGGLVYGGALDNAPFGKVEHGGEYVNYVEAALADLAAGRPVANPKTDAYGCSVKYAD